MFVTDVECTANLNQIEAVATHVEGNDITFTIEPQKALIDKNGCIRFFTMDWGPPNGVKGYKLHPYHTKVETRILWVTEFLAGFGLVRLGGKLMKANPKFSPAQNEGVHLARYFTFGAGGGYWVKSYIDDHFLPQHLGYHNIQTDALIWTKPLYIAKRQATSGN